MYRDKPNFLVMQVGFVFPSTLATFKVTGLTSSGIIEITNLSTDLVSELGTSLKTFVLNNSSLSDLSFLNGLTELTTINLSNNNITSIEGVRTALSNVTSLTLSYNNLTSLYGIQYFTDLQTLNLSYNTTLGDTCSYDGTTYNNIGLLTNLYNTNGTLKTLTLTGCTGITTDSTNSYWTTLTGISGLTVTGP